ncbi:amidohydrolase family protein [Patescibacteria group bacterium]
MFDTIIKNGTIIDGTGAAMRRADIGIIEGKIQKIGDMSEDIADVIIDASDNYVTPGFVDVTNHSDSYWRIFLNPDLESLIYQGITTIVGGNCGSSLAPLTDRNIILSVQKWADIRGINLDWLTIEDLWTKLERDSLSVNFATLVGHGTLRRGLLHDELRGVNEEEMDVMKKMFKESIKAGVLGLSSGLIYAHARIAPPEEIENLAELASKNKLVYATHLRDEANDIVKSIIEAVNVAKKTGVSLQLSHLKIVGEKNWHLVDEVIQIIEIAREEGVNINFDVYPYTSTGTVLYTLLPDWVSNGGKNMMLSKLKDSQTKKKVIDEMKKSSIDFEKLVIAISAINKTLSSRKIADIAKLQGKSVEETVLDVLVASSGRVIVTMDVINEKNLEELMKHPLSMISSNGAGYNLEHKNSEELVHPRNFGSFPRVLSEYVTKKRILTWETAIYKMSGMPAKKFNIKNRGVLKEGNFADILVIDPERIEDLSTIEDPYHYSKGIDNMLINGESVICDGKYTNRRSGIIVS